MDVMDLRKPKVFFILFALGMLLAVCSCICCGGSIFFGVKSSMESSGAYTQSLEAVQHDARVVQALGEPVERDGVMITGNINVTPNAGSAQLNYTVKGSTGKTAEVSVHATKSFDLWTFQVIDVQLEPGQAPISVAPLLE